MSSTAPYRLRNDTDLAVFLSWQEPRPTFLAVPAHAQVPLPQESVPDPAYAIQVVVDPVSVVHIPVRTSASSSGSSASLNTSQATSFAMAGSHEFTIGAGARHLTVPLLNVSVVRSGHELRLFPTYGTNTGLSRKPNHTEPPAVILSTRMQWALVCACVGILLACICFALALYILLTCQARANHVLFAKMSSGKGRRSGL